MSRYQPMTPERIARQIKAGRGQGEGENYLPWFEAPSIPSQGRLVRTISVTTGRVMHLVSELEGSIQLLADFDCSINEQYEQVLLRPELTYDIARQMRIRHVRARKGRHLVPMTTDLMFRFEDKQRGEHAVAVKYRSEINGRRGLRTQRQLAVEEMYHLMQGRRFTVATDADAPPLVMTNLRWLRESLRTGSASVIEHKQSSFEKAFPRSRASHASIGQRITKAAQASNLSFEEGVDAFRRAVWHRRIPADLNYWLRLSQPLVTTQDPNLGVKLPWMR